MCLPRPSAGQATAPPVDWPFETFHAQEAVAGVKFLRRCFSFIVALVCLLCGSQSSAAKPQRIVSLSPTATEIIFALGQGDQVVGVTRYDDFPAQTLRLPKVGGFVDADVEAIMALQPTLVVAARTSAGQRTLATLRRLKVPVLTLKDATLSDLEIAIRTLGDALRTAAAAKVLLATVQRELQGGCAAAPALPPPTVLVVVGRRPLVVAGPGSFYHSLLGLAGAQNVYQANRPFAVLDLEAIVALDPDFIVDVAASEAGAAETFWRARTNLRAIASARLRPISDTRLLRMGPRLGQGLRLMCDALRRPQPMAQP